MNEIKNNFKNVYYSFVDYCANTNCQNCKYFTDTTSRSECVIKYTLDYPETHKLNARQFINLYVADFEYITIYNTSNYTILYSGLLEDIYPEKYEKYGVLNVQKGEQSIIINVIETSEL